MPVVPRHDISAVMLKNPALRVETPRSFLLIVLTASPPCSHVHRPRVSIGSAPDYPNEPQTARAINPHRSLIRNGLWAATGVLTNPPVSGPTPVWRVGLARTR
jgi:hypothetical protein